VIPDRLPGKKLRGIMIKSLLPEICPIRFTFKISMTPLPVFINLLEQPALKAMLLGKLVNRKVKGYGIGPDGTKQ
jgi:hypothetical protein